MSRSNAKRNNVETLRTALEAVKPKLYQVASRHLSVDRVIRLLLSAASRNPKILDCSQQSILLFAMKCSETGLEPIGAGGAWPIPYENRKNGTCELQFIPDYRGLVNSAKRSGCIVDAWSEVVRANDEFDYALGLEPYLKHKPARGDRGALESAYCVMVMPDGVKRFVVMDGDEVQGIRARSRAKNDGPWVTDESEMWKKTVVRRAMKPFAGASPELDAAIEAEDHASGVLVLDPIALPRAKEPEPSPDPDPDPDPAPATSDTVDRFRAFLGEREGVALSWMRVNNWIGDGEGLEAVPAPDLEAILANEKTQAAFLKQIQAP